MGTQKGETGSGTGGWGKLRRATAECKKQTHVFNSPKQKREYIYQSQTKIQRKRYLGERKHSNLKMG